MWGPNGWDSGVAVHQYQATFSEAESAVLVQCDMEVGEPLQGHPGSSGGTFSYGKLLFDATCQAHPVITRLAVGTLLPVV